MPVSLVCILGTAKKASSTKIKANIRKTFFFSKTKNISTDAASHALLENVSKIPKEKKVTNKVLANADLFIFLMLIPRQITKYIPKKFGSKKVANILFL
ncbi:hypothetical protein A2709_03280 [candidate division WWE3 bacterium RIFCSPHIGHO2_01_FULL_43_9]|uniref:Uncharacterized protein n=1 Tax=candidate division WWE3 bacterium RIFCSPHIGHO2_01_FULL_43_9 TaxID=1802618 RepID=A0A1F4V555_UNCKA|nr:MAG: hypothetical protein A2709_03280 [candidate division WWE3 bacterium RIFCSPHIGHO2_01_FULL_43_9]